MSFCGLLTRVLSNCFRFLACFQAQAPAKRKAIPARVRADVWAKYCGDKDFGHCYVCAKQVKRYDRGWDCSHVVADALGGPSVVSNLRVCCPHCNRSMGTQNLYDYKRKHY